MERTIRISGVPVKFVATAATPAKFNVLFKGEDYFKTLFKIREWREDDLENADIMSLQKIAFAMSVDANKGVKFEQWLEQFDMFDVIKALPEIMELMNIDLATNNETETDSKKAEAVER